MADLTISPGDIPTAAQWNTYFTHTGGAWNTWTPTITQSTTVSLASSACSYCRVGRLIIGSFIATISGTGVAGNLVTISLPVAATYASAHQLIVGFGNLFDTSVPDSRNGSLHLNSATTVKIRAGTTGGETYQGAAGFTAALAVNDILSGSFWYEATTG